nr:Alpha-ketoglutarate-dependent dioxygenase alkB -like protein 2 [Ipomoea batatas]
MFGSLTLLPQIYSPSPRHWHPTPPSLPATLLAQPPVLLINLLTKSVRFSLEQAADGISQISFSTNEKIYPKKLTTIHEVAKQRELSGTLESESNLKIKKQLSDAKCKELSGNEIFGPPSVAPPRSLIVARSMESKESKFIGESAPRNVCMSVKVSNPTRGQSNIMFGDEPVVKTIKKIHS